MGLDSRWMPGLSRELGQDSGSESEHKFRHFLPCSRLSQNAGSWQGAQLVLLFLSLLPCRRFPSQSYGVAWGKHLSEARSQGWQPIIVWTWYGLGVESRRLARQGSRNVMANWCSEGKFHFFMDQTRNEVGTSSVKRFQSPSRQAWTRLSVDKLTKWRTKAKSIDATQGPLLAVADRRRRQSHAPKVTIAVPRLVGPVWPRDVACAQRHRPRPHSPSSPRRRMGRHVRSHCPSGIVKVSLGGVEVARSCV